MPKHTTRRIPRRQSRALALILAQSGLPPDQIHDLTVRAERQQRSEAIRASR